jgi:glycosyltransferase involved in cell wall biosynthesis
MSDSNESSVLILMGTYNGEKYIREQLDSIAAQTHKNWSLLISDDGSTDATIEIAKQWAQELGTRRVEFQTGPKLGFAANYASMACDSRLNAEFYAFCDQDDVWLPNKLRIAVDFLMNEEFYEKPLLYCSRAGYVRNDLKVFDESTLCRREPSFANALVQCIAGGNTMVFNNPLKKILSLIGPVYPASHDWWLYQLTLGIGGRVHYDHEYQLLYRQHEHSQVGGNRGFRAKIKRLLSGLRGDFRARINQNKQCLKTASRFFTSEALNVYALFYEKKEMGFLERTFSAKKLGIHRQSLFENIGLYLLLILKKL